MAQIGQKSEAWKQKRANMRASVSMRVRVRVRARARAATLPGGGHAEDGSELRSLGGETPSWLLVGGEITGPFLLSLNPC